MTLIVSIPHPDGIIMGADSRETVESFLHQSTTPETTYKEVRKLNQVEGIGCISFWGDITSVKMKIKEFLYSDLKKKNVFNVSDLANSIKTLLPNWIKENNNPVGFHIGGYLNGEPKLFHIFYGTQVGEKGKSFELHMNDESQVAALYNGEPEQAHPYILFLLELEREVGMVKWLTKQSIETASRFVIFLIKRAQNYSNTIGGNIFVTTIYPNNLMTTVSSVRDSNIDIGTESTSSFRNPNEITFMSGTSVQHLTVRIANKEDDKK